MVSHLAPSHRVAAGLKLPPSVNGSFAAAQAAWRFYSNERVSLRQLSGPLIDCARAGVACSSCPTHVLVVHDWSNLHYNAHAAKRDRTALSRRDDLGYELLTALAVDAADGCPVAPLCVQLRCDDGVYSSRAAQPVPREPPSQLDGLGPVMDHVAALRLGPTPVHVIDREADSVGHYRAWDRAGHRFIVRGDDQRVVLHEGRERRLGDVPRLLRSRGAFVDTREVSFHDKPARQFVAETTVVLHRPAYPNRVPGRKGKGKGRRNKRVKVPGEPLTLRLIVSEVRDARGRVRARAGYC